MEMYHKCWTRVWISIQRYQHDKYLVLKLQNRSEEEPICTIGFVRFLSQNFKEKFDKKEGVGVRTYVEADIEKKILSEIVCYGWKRQKERKEENAIGKSLGPTWKGKNLYFIQKK